MKVKDFKHERRGVLHLKVSGKGGKTRYVPLHPAASTLTTEYLEVIGHGLDDAGTLFRSVHNSRIIGSREAMTPDAIYNLVREYPAALGFEIGAHSLRAMAATTARISRKCRNGSDTRTSRRRASMTTGDHVPGIALLSK